MISHWGCGVIRSIAIFTDTGRLIVKWSAAEITVDYDLLSGLLAAIGTLSQSLGMGKPGIINFEDHKIIFVKNPALPELNFTAECSSDDDLVTCKNLLDYLTRRFIDMYGHLSDEELEGDMRKFRDFPEIIHQFFERRLHEMLSRLNSHAKDASIYFFDSEGNRLFSVSQQSEEAQSISLDLLNQFMKQLGFSNLKTLSGSSDTGVIRLYTFSNTNNGQKFHLLVIIPNPRKKTIATRIKDVVKEYQRDIHAFYWQFPFMKQKDRKMVRMTIDQWLESMNVDMESIRIDWNVLIDLHQNIKADALVSFQPRSAESKRVAEERVGIVNILNTKIPCTRSEYIAQVRKLEIIGNAMKTIPAFVAIYSRSGFSSDALNYHQERPPLNIKNRFMTVYLLSPNESRSTT